MHHADVPTVLVQRGGGSEISVDEPIPTEATPSPIVGPIPSPAVDDEPAPTVEYESDHDDHAPQKRKRTSTTKCRQGFSKSWLTKFDWLTYNSVDNSMGCRVCRQQRCEGVWVSGTRNFRVHSLALHAASKVS